MWRTLAFAAAAQRTGSGSSSRARKPAHIWTRGSIAFLNHTPRRWRIWMKPISKNHKRSLVVRRLEKPKYLDQETNRH